MDNVVIKPCSRWITVNSKVVTKRHSLECYCDDFGDGELWLDYFRYNNREWAINQFIVFCSPWCGVRPNYIDSKGNAVGVSAYDGTNYYKPLLLEVNDDCSKIRLWLEV